MPGPGSGYSRVNGNDEGTNWGWVICWLFVAGIAIAGLGVGIASLVRVNGHDHPTAFAEISLNDPPGFLEFNSTTTCMKAFGFKMDHEKNMVVGDDHIMVSTSGVYWYHISSQIHFTEHFFRWTPWKLFLGVDGAKKLTEGSAHDVAWWASNETFWDWPISPYAPADMDLTGMIEMQAGQKFNIFVGFPEFCKFCGLNEQDFHGPDNVTLVDARMSVRMIGDASPGRKVSSALFLLFGSLMFL